MGRELPCAFANSPGGFLLAQSILREQVVYEMKYENHDNFEILKTDSARHIIFQYVTYDRGGAVGFLSSKEAVRCDDWAGPSNFFCKSLTGDADGAGDVAEFDLRQCSDWWPSTEQWKHVRLLTIAVMQQLLALCGLCLLAPHPMLQCIEKRNKPLNLDGIAFEPSATQSTNDKYALGLEPTELVDEKAPVYVSGLSVPLIWKERERFLALTFDSIYRTCAPGFPLSERGRVFTTNMIRQCYMKGK
jgi:hypothetical protein